MTRSIPFGYLLPYTVLKGNMEFSPGSVPWELSLENSEFPHYICDVSASDREDVLYLYIKIKSLYQHQIYPFSCKWYTGQLFGCKNILKLILFSSIHTSPSFVNKGMLLCRPLQFPVYFCSFLMVCFHFISSRKEKFQQEVELNTFLLIVHWVVNVLIADLCLS